jgi:hypothetical protein
MTPCPLGESSEQPSVGSDHFRRTTSHAFLDPVDHLRIPPSQRAQIMTPKGFRMFCGAGDERPSIPKGARCCRPSMLAQL